MSYHEPPPRKPPLVRIYSSTSTPGHYPTPGSIFSFRYWRGERRQTVRSYVVLPTYMSAFDRGVLARDGRETRVRRSEMRHSSVVDNRLGEAPVGLDYSYPPVPVHPPGVTEDVGHRGRWRHSPSLGQEVKVSSPRTPREYGSGVSFSLLGPEVGFWSPGVGGQDGSTETSRSAPVCQRGEKARRMCKHSR